MIRSYKIYKLVESIEMFLEIDFNMDDTFKNIFVTSINNLDKELALGIGGKMSEFLNEHGFETLKIEQSVKTSVLLLFSGTMYDYLLNVSWADVSLRIIKKGVHEEWKDSLENFSKHLFDLNTKAEEETTSILILRGPKSDVTKMSNIIELLKQTESPNNPYKKRIYPDTNF